MKSVLHIGVSCDNCNVTPISGPRYKCSVCPNTDFCSKCMDSNEQSLVCSSHSDHVFYRINIPIPTHLPVFANLTSNKGRGFTCGKCGTSPIRGYSFDCSICFERRCSRCEQLNPCGHPVVKLLLDIAPESSDAVVSVPISGENFLPVDTMRIPQVNMSFTNVINSLGDLSWNQFRDRQVKDKFISPFSLGMALIMVFRGTVVP